MEFSCANGPCETEYDLYMDCAVPCDIGGCHPNPRSDDECKTQLYELNMCEDEKCNSKYHKLKRLSVMFQDVANGNKLTNLKKYPFDNDNTNYFKTGGYEYR